jgi:hypothetical protein
MGALALLAPIKRLAYFRYDEGFIGQFHLLMDFSLFACLSQ